MSGECGAPGRRPRAVRPPWFPECVPAAHSHLARPFSSRCSPLSNQPQPMCRQKPAQVWSLRAGPCSLHGVLKPPVSSQSVGTLSSLQQPQEFPHGESLQGQALPMITSQGPGTWSARRRCPLSLGTQHLPPQIPPLSSVSLGRWYHCFSWRPGWTQPPPLMLPRSGAAGQFWVRGREGRRYLVPGSITHLCETVCFPGLALLPGTLCLFLPLAPSGSFPSNLCSLLSQPRPHPHSPVSLATQVPAEAVSFLLRLRSPHCSTDVGR